MRRLRATVDCTMNYDETLNALLADYEPHEQVKECNSSPREQPMESGEYSQKRARLAALAAGGQTKQFGLTFHGRALTPDLIDTLSDDEIEKLHARYESRLGAAMTRTLGSSAIRIYASLATAMLPIPVASKAALVTDLEEDPFLNAALGNACCELYYRYGSYLAPLTCALTTVKHCKFGETEQAVNTPTEDGNPTVRDLLGCITCGATAGERRRESED